MGKLSGKVAVVTGWAGGIGRAIVEALAAEGADIGVVDKNADGADSVAVEAERFGVRTSFAQADVGDARSAFLVTGGVAHLWPRSGKDEAVI